VIRSFAQREAGAGAKLRDQWSPGIDAPAARGRADSGDIEIDLVELFTDIGGLAQDLGKGAAVFIADTQDLRPHAAPAPFGAGLPHLPAVLSASKSYSERLFSYQRIDRLTREGTDAALSLPAEDEDACYTVEALDALHLATGGYPYFIQAYGKAVWDRAPRS